MAKKLTKNQKILIGAGALLALGIGGYLIYRSVQKNKDKDKGQDSLTNEMTDTVTDEFTPAPDGEDMGNANVAPKGCNTVITTNDGNFNYAWCSDAWWTISKSTPASGSRVIPVWSSLKNNQAATDKLNAKYPNKGA